MSKHCCDGTCNQGRGCPARAARIATRPSVLRRAGDHIAQALDDHKWLPLAIAIVLLMIVNFPT